MSEKIKKVEEKIVEVEPAPPYVLKKLTAEDIWPMVRLLGKLGINEFAQCLGSSNVVALVSDLFKNESKEKDKKESNDNKTLMVAGGVLLEMLNKILQHLPTCETEVYELLSRSSGMTKEEIKALDFDVFFEMLTDFVMKEEFKVFSKVALKLSGKVKSNS